MNLRRSLLLPVLAVALAACGASSATPTPVPATAAPATPAPATAAPATAVPAQAADLQVYAAASLKALLAKAKEAYEAANPGTTITVSTDSSTALETKIEQGAPADVFLSADVKNPQKLVDGGFGSGPVTIFAGNKLTVIVPTANPAEIGNVADLARSGVKIIACADGVPIAKYTAILLDNLARQAGFPADFAAQFNANVVSHEDNAGAVVTKVGLGEGDAGVVYVTDAKGSDKVTMVDIPAGANVPASYGGVTVKASRSPGAAAAFLAWLAGDAGQALFQAFGFQPVQ
ncbi:MAG: molybdate ABC transporter substrate-binding protein [Chloroflexota bacterium]